MLEEGLVTYIDDIIDCGVLFLVSEKNNGFLKYLLSRSYRAAIMTPGQELEIIKTRVNAVFIAVNRVSPLAFKLKTVCEDNRIPSQLFLTDNSMSQARYV